MQQVGVDSETDTLNDQIVKLEVTREMPILVHIHAIPSSNVLALVLTLFNLYNVETFQSYLNLQFFEYSTIKLM